MITISGWAYEGDIHCNDCAAKRFGKDLWKCELPTMHLHYIECVYDLEGNIVRPFYGHDEGHGCACSDCFEECV